MIFSDSPSQKALERMMTQVKGFPPRGSGVMVLRRFEYTAEMCTAVCASITTERKNAQSANAHASRNELLPELQTDPRLWLRQ